MKGERHFFPGGNTVRGFYSYYAHAIRPGLDKRVIILKGGPGVGKSTLMRHVGNAFKHKGYAVEWMHCSSDPGSLDGVRIPKVGLALVDGTKPHIVDPVLPGAADGILNLGVALDEAGMAKHVREVEEIGEAISGCFAQAYRYLAAAAPLREDEEIILRGALDAGKINAVTAELLAGLDANSIAARPGKERRLFAGAVTPLGCIHYLNELGAQRVWRLEGPWAMPAQDILSRVRAGLLESGVDIEGFYCPMEPERIEHLLIPETGLLITTANSYQMMAQTPERVIDLEAALDREKLSAAIQRRLYNSQTFDSLIEQAAQSVTRAKGLHDDLEKIYIAHMDFARVTAMQQALLAQLETLG